MRSYWSRLVPDPMELVSLLNVDIGSQTSTRGVPCAHGGSDVSMSQDRPGQKDPASQHLPHTSPFLAPSVALAGSPSSHTRGWGARMDCAQLVTCGCAGAAGGVHSSPGTQALGAPLPPRCTYLNHGLRCPGGDSAFQSFFSSSLNQVFQVSQTVQMKSGTGKSLKLGQEVGRRQKTM